MSTAHNTRLCAITADATQHQVRCSSSVSADPTQMSNINKHQLLYIYQQQLRSDGTRNAATAQSPVRYMRFPFP
jgi:hypothetical protein